MRVWDFSHYALLSSAALILLGGCGGSQPSIGVPGTSQGPLEHRAHEAHFRVLYRFQGDYDGSYPTTNLINVNGTLYGTTQQGGGSGCYGVGCGTVYSLSPKGVETVLHRFGSGLDGVFPSGRLTLLNGMLYGVTQSGGDYNGGTVYSITTTGTENVLHSFQYGSLSVSHPSGKLSVMKGILYGTTVNGGNTACGRGGCGTVYSITPAGVFTILHSFDDDDGSLPEAGMAKMNRTLYGTTVLGGSTSGSGVVFSITTSGSEKVLYRFQGSPDASQPLAAPIDVNGKLYGTTLEGGTEQMCGSSAGRGCGTVFSVTTSGVEAVVHSFGGPGDGVYPQSALVKLSGTLYGTTIEGGIYNRGSVFGVTPAGVEAVVHDFAGGSLGWYPQSGLLDVNSTLYGTASYGGSSGCSGNGCGIVFTLKP